MRGMLPPGIEAQPRIQGNARYLLIRDCARIKLELKDFFTASRVGMQRAQQAWLRERCPVSPYGDALGHGQPAFLPTVAAELIRSANDSELAKPPRSIQLLPEVELKIPGKD